MFSADALIPGSYRAAQVLPQTALIEALLQVERAWVAALSRLDAIDSDLAEHINRAMGTVDEDLAHHLAVASENGGNPVIDLVKVLRTRVGESVSSDAAKLVHTGMTSQDVMDTAMMLCARRACESAVSDLQAAGDALAKLTEAHRLTPCMGRTLAQQALPTTFGARAATWLLGLSDALEQLAVEQQQLQVSLAGAAGNMAATVALVPEGEDAAEWVAELTAAFADELDLAVDSAGVWHTRRTPIQRLAVALADVSLALGKVANDVIESARNEVAELAEPAAEGRGGSSAMAHKRNPVLSVLLRRSAMNAASSLGALYSAAALSHEERSAGAWHAEWEPLAALMKHAIISAQIGRELLEGLEVHSEAMVANIQLLAPEEIDLASVQTGIAANLADRATAHWQGLSAELNDLAD